MDVIEGLVCGMIVKNMGSFIIMLVGKEVFGCILNVIGDFVDEVGEVGEI